MTRDDHMASKGRDRMSQWIVTARVEVEAATAEEAGVIARQKLADEATLRSIRANDLLDPLEFYADPDTYFAVGFWFDPPCGGFDEDDCCSYRGLGRARDEA